MGRKRDQLKMLLFPHKVADEVARISEQGDKKLKTAERKATKLEAALEETITIRIATAVGVNKNGR